jgi:hypothetical protein
MTVYQQLATLITARLNCVKSGNTVWYGRHSDAIEDMMKNSPSGSGINSGTEIALELCSPEKLVFQFSFEFMNENGYYDGSKLYRITVRPSLAFGINLTINGSNRDEIKDYLHEVYDTWLRSDAPAPESIAQ